MSPEKSFTASFWTWNHLLAHVNLAGIKGAIDQNVFKGTKLSSGTFGSRYFITFIDIFSKLTVVFTMHKKSKALECPKKYHKQVEVHARKRLKNS